MGDDIFEHLGEGSGLASQVITGFAEDGDGFLWIASQGGLQRWDGYRLTTYKSQPGVADSLPDNLTHVLHTDPAGNLWVGTSSGGLARYDRQTNRFVRYGNSVHGTAPVNVESIEDDGQGGLWVGSGTGLDHLNSVTGTFTHMTPAGRDGAAIDMGSVQTLRRSADGTLLIGTTQGLMRSAPGSQQGQLLERVPIPNHSQDAISVQCMYESAGTLWIGTDHGLYLMASSGDAATPYRPPSGAALPAELFTTSIASIVAGRSGRVWVGTQDQGLFVVAPSTWTVRHVAHDATQSTSLADDWISRLFLSRQGVLWIGSRRGVSYIDTTPKRVSTLLGGEGPNVSIRDSDVYAVLPRRDGTIWLGLSKHGIDILSPSGKRIAEIQSATGSADGGTANTLPSGTVGALSESASGGVYIATEHGLYLAEDADLRAASLRPGAARASPHTFHPSVKRLPIGAEAAQGLIQVLPDRDRQGHEFLWLGGNNGLWTYDPARPGPAKRMKLNAPLTDPRILVLLRGAGDMLWVGTLNGLNRLNVLTGEVLTIPPNPTNSQGLGAGMISTLLLDRKGRLWVGTFSGGIHALQSIDAHGNARFHRMLEDLPNDDVDCLIEAADGKIWASTDGGLAEIDPFNFDVKVLGRAEGAVIATYWNGVGGKSSEGDLFLGGSGGLTIVRPALIAPWTYTPPVVVTSARIGLNNVPLYRFNDGPGEAPIWVPAGQNDLEVEFAALDYTAPSRNHYEYKLDGFDRDWIAADPDHRVLRYTNLPPGRFTLLLRGSNRDGLWAPTREIKILVLPARYQRAWFRVLAVLLVLLLLSGILTLATAYMRRRQRELERQVALRTAELKLSQQKLEHMAYTDSLTGLPNRRMFSEHFGRLLALKRRQQGTFAVLLMDFDGFKVINDTYGHDAGDTVLRVMAQRMSTLVRESDCLARLGGDEYALILGQSPDAEAAGMVCQKIIDSFRDPVLFRGLELRTSPSIGVALYPCDGKTQDELYKSADLALYDAKRGGGNRCCWSEGAASRLPSTTPMTPSV